MFVIEFQSRDMPEVRCSISPLFELWQSIGALQAPESKDVLLPWIDATLDRTRDLPLELLYALQPTHCMKPDFIHPPPTMPMTSLEDELDRLMATEAGRIRDDLELCYPGRLPLVLEPFLTEPRKALRDLAERLRDYWDVALAPYWNRLRAVLEGDVLSRARDAEGGPSKLFDEIHESVSFVDHRLEICAPWDGRLMLGDQGLLLVPSVFVWPKVAVIEHEPWQPTIIYPVRGGGLLWEPGDGAPDALAALIGPRRAAVLTALEAPRSTTELARQLEMSQASVSQHLSVLHAGGLISRHRVGRSVLYLRSAKGDALAGERRAQAS
jgi:hypothetical protein